MKKKFPKTFEDENSFKKYIKNNKNYVLNMFCEGILWSDEKYVCDSNILIFAVRYAIGRKTGAVTKIVEWILKEWNNLTKEDRTDIIKEILEYEKHYGNLGMDWQRELWYRIVNKEIFGWIDEIK